MGYRMPDALPVDALPGGTSVLLVGPPLTRKRELLLEMLGADGPEEAAAVITMKKRGQAVIEEYERVTGGTTDALHVVDCVGRPGGVETRKSVQPIEYVSSAHDLTGLSIALSGLFKDFATTGTEARVGAHHLSTFLMYHDLQRVYRMTHVLTGHVDVNDWLGVFVVDAPTEREVDMLSQLVDGLIRTKTTDEGQAFRTRGFATNTDGWQAY